MNRTGSIAIAGLLLLGLSLGASALSAELLGFSVAMGHINELVDGFNLDSEVELGALRAGAGIELAGDVATIGSAVSLGVGGRGLLSRVSERDVAATALLFGVFGRGTYALGRWFASGDLGAYLGSFSFPSARLTGLRGVGLGLGGRIGYALPFTDRLGLDIQLGLEWMPIQQMTDAAGQKYRGRGTPFMDFSGLSVSIGVIW